MNDSEQKDSIEELVDYMVLEDNNFPFDFSFRLIDDRYPESTHQCLNFPGIFVKPLETEVFTDDGINLRMDAAHLVLPDDTIPQKSAEGIEHQSNRLDFKKIDAIYDYKVGLIHNNNLPAISVVVTNIDYELSEIIFESHGDAFKIYFKILDDDEIYERLNTLKNIINSNQRLSEHEALNFAYIPIFVRKHIAKEVTEKVVELFSSVDYLDENLQMDIHQVLKRMIKVHFVEDENKVRELLTMITKAVDDDVRNKFPSYVRALEQIQERDAAIARQKKTIESRDELLSSQEDMLNSMDELLAEKDLVIERLRQELDIAKSK